MHPIHSSRLSSESQRPVWFSRSVLPAVFIAAAIAAASCGSSTSTSSVTTGPTAGKCQIALTASSNVVADGGAGSISVGTQPECEWSVSTQTSWISEISPASGQGNGKVDFRAAPNAASSAREGEIVVNDSRVRVMQDAAPCRFSITPGDQTVSSADGNGSVAVAAPNGCAWTATSHEPWLTITSGASGSGNGTVAVRIAANSGAARTGTLTIADRTHTVTQVAPGTPAPGPSQPCTYTVNPTAANVAAEGGTGAAMVTAAANCPWTASSNAPWLTVTSGASGIGNGSVGYSIAANSGAARDGTITIAGQTLTISQAAVAPACAYAINPTTANVAAGAAAGPSVTVTTTAGCMWGSSSNAPWLTITSGASGNGSGTVGYNVAANTGGARDGTLAIAGRLFTVTQAAAAPSCTYSIDPASVNVAAGAGAGPAVSVTATAGCGWMASSNAPWLTVTSGANGNGNGTVGYNIAANTGGARNGTLTIAGQMFTVMQAAAATSCTYNINPTSANAPAGGGGGNSVTVTTSAGCTWNASSNVPWISVMSGSGNGNGMIGYAVAANNGSARTGTLTIAGQTFTVMQASGCTYTIDPTSANFPVLGGNDNVRVTAANGCAWTANTPAPWINIIAGASDSGNGMVRFTVSLNAGAMRSATITIAGRAFTVTQNGIGGRFGGSHNGVSVDEAPQR
jgi:hypothetical protein